MDRIKQIITTLLVVLILPASVVYIIFDSYSCRTTERTPVEIEFSVNHISSTDHSEFESLQKEFESPHDVTQACIDCHTGRASEIMASAHWRWERETEIPGRGTVTVGKKNLLNNFCTGATGNNGSCMRCHIGYGWEDTSFDFEDPLNVDCLVCHDQTGTYFKKKGEAGYPATAENATVAFPEPDYNYVSQNVGLPKNENCGACHFYGGGGNNVKHGDLEEALLTCTFEVDVHMSDSLDLQCIDCHQTEKHNITGKLYSVSSANKNRVTCEQCHSMTPHQDKVIDEHYVRVACQTCHIPTYARVNSTKVWWDWSTAGQLKDGKQYSEDDADGNHNYLSAKGDFVWDDNIVPEYSWFNGTADHYLNEDTISEIPVKINTLFGNYQDSSSKIWPVKIHRGRQMYDTINKTIVHLKLHADNEGEGAFWKDFDWDTAAHLGMQYNERPFSGQTGFVETEVSWPLNHMVSPKDQALSCESCHTSGNSRLSGISDFYLPGRDRSKAVEHVGNVLIIVSILAVVVHGALRILSSPKNKMTRE